jgi:hypothetical protein
MRLLATLLLAAFLAFLIVFTSDALTPPEPKPYRPVGYCACPEGHDECLQGAFWQCEHINHERET